MFSQTNLIYIMYYHAITYALYHAHINAYWIMQLFKMVFSTALRQGKMFCQVK